MGQKENGGKKIINLYENDNQLVKSAIDKIVVEILGKNDNIKTHQSLLLTACSPLAGTTSTCIGLGIAMANTGRKTLLIDCDVRKILKYKKLNEEITFGLSDYLSENLEQENSTELVIYKTNIENLSYIPCGTHIDNPTRTLCSVKMESLLNEAKQRFDIVILDFPSLAIVPDAQVLFQNVDGIILLAALGETRKRQIKEAKMRIASAGEKYYGMIVNKIQLDTYRRNACDYDYYFMDKKGEQKLNNSSARKKYLHKVKHTK